MIKIVIVEDDEDWIEILHSSLEENLLDIEKEIFSIKYENETQVLQKIRSLKPTLAILDINMANSSRAGIRLAEKIKKSLPQIDFRFLSAQKEKDKDILWDVAKLTGEPPFEKSDFQNNMDVFVAFIANILKNKLLLEDTIIKGSLKIIKKSKEVYLQDKEIKLTPMEYEILLCLVKRPNTIYSKLQLYNQTKNYEVTQGTSEETVVSHIKSIRDKLKKYDKNFTPIETVTNSGYKFRWRAP